jgi:GTP pyrophosphokinase
MIEVSWGNQAEIRYLVQLKLKAYDRPGLVHDISNILAAEKINIVRLNSYTDKLQNINYIDFTVEIPSLVELEKILHRLKQLPNVFEIRRS